MNRIPAQWFAFEQLESRQLLASITWDGGGGDTNWDNPLNWSGDALPTINDSVVIDAPGHPVIHISQNAAWAQALTSHDPIDISGGSLFVDFIWSQQAALTLSGGSATVDSDLILGGDVLWTGGSLTGGGKSYITAGHNFTIDGDVFLDREIDNDGFMEWRSGNIVTQGAITLVPLTPPSIVNRFGRTFLIESPGTLSSMHSMDLVNDGTLVVHDAPGSTTTIGIGFNNYDGPFLGLQGPGTVDVQSGTLALTGYVHQKPDTTLTGGNWYVSSSDARLLLPGPDLLYVNGKVILNGSGAAFPAIEHAAGIADLTLSGGRAFTIAPDAPALSSITRLTIDNPGMTTVVPILHGHELIVHSGRVDITGGLEGSIVRVDLNTVLVLSGISRLPYADVSGAGLIRVKGELDWPSGTIAGPGQLVITETGHLTMTGQYYEYFDKTLTRRIINRGTMDWSSTSSTFIHFTTEVVNRGIWNLSIAGYLGTTSDIGPGSTPAYITNYGIINSYASLIVRGAGGAVRLNNQGTIHVVTGSLTFNGGAYGRGTWIADSGAELVFGGFGTILTSPVFSGAGRIREAAGAWWFDPHITGTGDLLITVPGRLMLFGTSLITRSTITNNGSLILGDWADARITANFANNGVLNVGAGSVNITGNLTLSSTSTLRARSIGPIFTPRVFVSGNAALAGAMTAVFDWHPYPGFAFDFLTAGSHTGAFSSISGIGLLPPFETIQFSFVGGTARLTIITL